MVAFDEDVADRVRGTLGEMGAAADERRMFGGIAFMVGGHMTVGVIGEELIVRVGQDGEADALAHPHAREMDFTGRPMTGWVYVAPEGFAEEEELAAWVRRGLEFAGSLPAR